MKKIILPDSFSQTLYRNELEIWEFGKAAKTCEGLMDLRSAKQVSEVNRARREP